MSEYVYAGLTSQSVDVFLADSSSTTGGGLTALVYNTSGLTCYYRKGATGTATAVTLATQTVGGAYSSGGFVQIDATNMPGVYRFDIPNAAVDTEGFVTIYFQGAADLVPTPLRIDCRPVAGNVKQINGEEQPTIDLAYPDGYIYIDTVAGTSGTTAGVNGTKFNPVDTIANAMTLSDSGSVGIKKFNIWGNSSITPATSVKGYTFEGAGYTFDPNGQDLSYATVIGADLNSSTLPSAGDRSRYHNCYLNGATIGKDAFYYDSMISSVTLNGNVHIENGRCASLPESESWFTFESGVSVRARILDWQGDARLYGMGVGSANHKVRIHGGGTVTIDATSTAGSIYLVGDITVVDEVVGGFLGTLVHEYMPEKVRVEMDDNSTDLDSILTNISGVQVIVESGSSAWTTAEGFATPANVTAAQDTIIASGSDWVTASGFNTVAPDNSGIAAIQAKTDQMNFGVTNQLDANIESINTVGVSGAGTSDNKWRGS